MSPLLTTVIGVLLRRVCPRCRRAGRPLCERCLRDCQSVGIVTGLPGLDSASVLYRYEPVIQKLVLAAKNGGRRDILRALGVQMADLAETHTFVDESGPDSGSHPCGGRPVVSWVPASRSGRRQRGFDQGAFLARVVAGELGVASRPLPARRLGRRQTGNGRSARLHGPNLVPTGAAAPHSVLLVDDVITTGASMAAASAVLRLAGASRVVGLAVAWASSHEEAAMGRPIAVHRRRS